MSQDNLFMILNFDVKKQIITRTDQNQVVANSKNYLKAKFSFTEEWQGKKTALFKHKSQNLVYELWLDENDTCFVPWEVIKSGSFFVSVVCGELITTSNACVDVDDSGFNGDKFHPTDPTPSVYSQILKIAQSVRDDADAGKFNGKDGAGAKITEGENILVLMEQEGVYKISFNNDGTFALANSVYSKSEIDNALNLKADKTALSSYATTAALNLKADKTALDTLATKTELEKGLNEKQAKGNYALKSEIPDVSNFATTAALNLKADKTALSSYATTAALDLKADKTALSSYATTDALNAKADKTALDNLVTKTELEAHETTAAAELAKKEDRPVIITLTSESVEMAPNHIFRAEELASVTITLPAAFDDDFISKIDFTSGATAAAFTAPDTIKWSGDDVVDNAFVPVANKRYSIFVYYDGVFVRAISKGILL